MDSIFKFYVFEVYISEYLVFGMETTWKNPLVHYYQLKISPKSMIIGQISYNFQN